MQDTIHESSNYRAVQSLSVAKRRLAQIRRKHNVANRLLAKWRYEYEARNVVTFTTRVARGPNEPEALKHASRIEELEDFYA